MWIRTCRLRSWFSSTVFRTALSEMSRTWEERWQQWFYNAVILEGRWRSRFYPDRDHGNDNTWQWRRLPGRWSPQLYLDHDDNDDNNDNGGNYDDDEDCDDDAYRVGEVLNFILTMMTTITMMTIMRITMMLLTGSVKSSIVSWPAAAAADNFSIASAAETSCRDVRVSFQQVEYSLNHSFSSD